MCLSQYDLKTKTFHYPRKSELPLKTLEQTHERIGSLKENDRRTIFE